MQKHIQYILYKFETTKFPGAVELAQLKAWNAAYT